MQELHIALSSIADEGEHKQINNNDMAWDVLAKEHNLICKNINLTADVFLLPQSDKSVLIQGTLTGSLELPCVRCTEMFYYTINEKFDIYEEFEENEADKSEVLHKKQNTIYLDLQAVLWEQLALAIPFINLCTENCVGLCAICGAKKDDPACVCETEEGDTRLAILRKLKI